MMKIIQAETPEHIAQTRILFREYEAWLGLDLCFQGFEQELAALPGKYAPPKGRLLLAVENEVFGGCAALREIEPGICEMKRLFVREAFRGRGLGKEFLRRLITEAREIGYQKMRLDTLPAQMEKAVHLYRQAGFREIAPYYRNPVVGALFMELTL